MRAELSRSEAAGKRDFVLRSSSEVSDTPGGAEVFADRGFDSQDNCGGDGDNCSFVGEGDRDIIGQERSGEPGASFFSPRGGDVLVLLGGLLKLDFEGELGDERG